MATVQVNNIGKSNLTITSGASTGPQLFNYDFPLTEQGGFTMRYIEDSFFHVLQNLDITAPQKQEKKFVTGVWFEWTMRWSNFPLPRAAARKILDALTQQGIGAITNILTFTPKISSPDFKFPVNYTGGGIVLNNSDSNTDIGNYGMELIFKTSETYNAWLYPTIYEPGVTVITAFELVT